MDLLFSRGARLLSLSRHAGSYNFLRAESGERMAERMLDVRCDFGDIVLHGHPDVGVLESWGSSCIERSHIILGADVDMLSVSVGSYDLVYSLLELHWVNDLSLMLFQMYSALREGGLLQGVMLGGETLRELRHCFLRAESECVDRISARFPPSIELTSLGGLLQGAGFLSPVVDSEVVSVCYSDMFHLLRDLRVMSEGNFLCERSLSCSRRDIFMRAGEIYEQEFSCAGGIIASFDLLFLHAWK